MTLHSRDVQLNVPTSFDYEMKRVHFIHLVFVFVCSFAFGSERARSILLEHKNEIVEASKSFGIAPRLLASIVYAEHSLNVKPSEDILDKVLALSGYNSSIGVAQIKVETARWICKQLENRSSMFSNSAGVSTFGKESSNDFVEQLSEPKTNLVYAAAYVSMILNVWQPLFKEASYEGKVAGVVASIYCLGLARSDGTLRLPHSNAKMNHFGEVAQSFYDSFELTNEFPK